MKVAVLVLFVCDWALSFNGALRRPLLQPLTRVSLLLLSALHRFDPIALGLFAIVRCLRSSTRIESTATTVTGARRLSPPLPFPKLRSLPQPLPRRCITTLLHVPVVLHE
jgi:hypothetical protein